MTPPLDSGLAFSVWLSIAAQAEKDALALLYMPFIPKELDLKQTIHFMHRVSIFCPKIQAKFTKNTGLT